MASRPIIMRKVSSVEKHLRRIKELPQISLDEFSNDANVQDILLFNLTQAIQNCIDIAAHIVSDEGWGVPATQSEMFDTLVEKSVISRELAKRLIAMVGFRNRVIHEYERLNLEIVYRVWTERLTDIEEFVSNVLKRFG